MEKRLHRGKKILILMTNYLHSSFPYLKKLCKEKLFFVTNKFRDEKVKIILLRDICKSMCEATKRENEIESDFLYR